MHLDKAAENAADGVITVEPMGNMPVIKDLIVDMDAVHWKKIQRVTPWLLPDGPGARARVHRAARVDDRRHADDGLHPVRRLRVGLPVDGGRPRASSARPRSRRPTASSATRATASSSSGSRTSPRIPHGIYDCTHCFNCIEACPKGVAPMSQIMRLRRIAGADHEINDRNNGHRHEKAFVTLVRDYGLLHEAELLPRSYGGDSWFGKFHPRAGQELARSLPSILKALQRGKVTPKQALLGAQDPQAGPRRGQAHLQARRTTRRSATSSTCTSSARRRSRRRRPPRPRRRGGQPPARREEPEHVKVAYWPGCVSRGFTPELHGSMAKVAPLLDIELVELDRARCCGAGVIAEHNQELADTLNARTFALAQQVEGADLMMNICSTCQGAQSECQERLDANTEYREHVNETLSAGGPDATRRASPTSTSCG